MLDKIARMSIAALAVLALASTPVMADADQDEDGQDEKEGEEQHLTLAQLPSQVRATVEAEARGGEIKEIEMEDKKGKVVFEVEILKEGKTIDIKVAADGTLLKRKVEGAKKR